MNLRAAYAFLPLLLVACAAESSDAPIAGEEPELRLAGIKSVEIGRSTGFVAPPPPGSCRAAGRYTIDFETKQMTGHGCVAGKEVDVNRTLSQAEMEKVQGAVRNVRTTSRPPACPTDMPVTSLKVNRANSSANLVDQRAACGSSVQPAVATTLAGVLSVAEELAVAATAKIAGFDFDGFRIAEVAGVEFCPEIVDAVAGACHEAGGNASPAKGCDTLCSVPVAPRGKVAGFDFDGFRVAQVGGAEICPEIVDAVASACHDAGGKASPAKGCDTVCSVPVAARGKVAGYDFSGPKTLDAPAPDMACPEIAGPELLACTAAEGRTIAAKGCKTLCSTPIAPR